MRYVTHVYTVGGLLLKASRQQQAALLLVILACVPKLSWGQTPGVYQTHDTRSLTQALERAKRGTQLNIFYVHGMGISPPDRNAGKQDFETSEEFRTQVCKRIHCTSKLVGRDYADRGLFELNSRAPLQYLGKDIWVTNEEWNAAAPFVDHYNLKLRGAYINDDLGPTVMLAKGLPQDPMIFTMGHELKHHLTDSGSSLSFCDACNQSDPIEIGAEIFAAELIYPDDDFRSDLGQMNIASGQCTPEVLARLKHETRTTLSYTGLAKRAEFMGFAAEGSLASVKWKKLEEDIYGEPLHKWLLRRRRGNA